MAPSLTPYFSALIKKYLSNYQAIERGESLQEDLIPRKVSRNNFSAVCRGEKNAVTAHEQAYMAWKKLDQSPQKGSAETTTNDDRNVDFYKELGGDGDGDAYLGDGISIRPDGTFYDDR
jgi:uncharacterized protein YifE (UPF0438 family)